MLNQTPSSFLFLHLTPSSSPNETLTVTSPTPLSMASCDDDFPLLPDDRHHHHHQQQQSHPQFQHQGFYRLNRFINKVATAPTARSPIRGGRDEGSERFADLSFTAKCASAFPDVAPFSGDEEAGEEEEAANQSSGRKEREEVIDGTALYKRSKIGEGSGSGSAAPGGGDYRRDREEWSDTAIGCLLEAYMSKYAQLNKGNLRGRDWEEVAGMVREGCQKQAKSVEQCKNKVDNLKKRYKLERHRMSSGGVSTSHWPWFQKMEEIFGDLVPRNTADLEEDKAVQSSSRQAKRYSVATANPVSPLLNVRMKQAPRLRWRRVVFKISGVALAGTGSGSNNFDPEVARLIASEVAKASRAGVEVAIVVGGRNLFCGDTWVTATGSDRSTAYQIGMMATVMNSILLQSAMEKMGIQARVQSGLIVQESAEPYNRQRAIRHLEKGRIVIFGGVGVGIGNPLFSTDTAAALRASEIHAEAVLKGANADGLYGCNSGNNNIFEHISFRALGSGGANFMDMMALSYCEENSIPVVVFNLLEPGNISKAICGEQVGTLIDQTGRIS
uniref:UMP kinase n=1 Tax=Kalanchoe fedtschenkoi TaxID=63787 RepID=A0A7N0UA99_KALFE